MKSSVRFIASTFAFAVLCVNAGSAAGFQNPAATPKPPEQGSDPAAPFVGVPKTMQDLYACAVVGNRATMIYYLKGNSIIKKMRPASKVCFATEADAVAKGFKKTRLRAKAK